jgi:hypothetical protein
MLPTRRCKYYFFPVPERANEARNEKRKTRNEKRMSLSPHRFRFRITPQDLDKSAVLLQLMQRIPDGFVVAVTLDVDEEKVLPVFSLRWPAFNFAHAQLEPIEWLQSRVQRADAIVNTKHQ